MFLITRIIQAGFDMFLFGAIKISALIILCSCICVLLQRSSSARRHFVWVVLFISILFLPVVSSVLPEIALPLPQKWVLAPSVTVQEMPQSEAVAIQKGGFSSSMPEYKKGENPISENNEQSILNPFVQAGENQNKNSAGVSLLERIFSVFLRNGSFIFLILWAVGAAVLLFRYIIGIFAANRMLKRSDIITDERIVHCAEQCARQFGLSRRIKLLQNRDISAPITFGIWNPVIILPAEAQEWDTSQISAIFIHELAHIQRYDSVWNALSHIASAVYWFNPLMWYAVRQLRIEQEYACDDAVILSGGQPATYAEYLLSFMRSDRNRGLSPASVLPFLRHNQIEMRIRAILNPVITRKRLKKSFVITAVFIAVITILPVAALTFSPQEQNTSRQTSVETEAILQQTALVHPPYQENHPTTEPAHSLRQSSESFHNEQKDILNTGISSGNELQELQQSKMILDLFHIQKSEEKLLIPATDEVFTAQSRIVRLRQVGDLITVYTVTTKAFGADVTLKNGQTFPLSKLTFNITLRSSVKVFSAHNELEQIWDTQPFMTFNFQILPERFVLRFDETPHPEEEKYLGYQYIVVNSTIELPDTSTKNIQFRYTPENTLRVIGIGSDGYYRGENIDAIKEITFHGIQSERQEVEQFAGVFPLLTPVKNIWNTDEIILNDGTSKEITETRITVPDSLIKVVRKSGSAFFIRPGLETNDYTSNILRLNVGLNDIDKFSGGAVSIGSLLIRSGQFTPGATLMIDGIIVQNPLFGGFTTTADTFKIVEKNLMRSVSFSMRDIALIVHLVKKDTLILDNRERWNIWYYYPSSETKETAQQKLKEASIYYEISRNAVVKGIDAATGKDWSFPISQIQEIRLRRY
jgi:beta-lactamase regulating signal transducer with metallopeptidase domain